MRTHYDNLQVKEVASALVIRASYKALAQKHHPDRNPDNADEAARIFKILNEAYSVLSDPARRSEYDSSLKARRAEDPESGAFHEQTNHQEATEPKKWTSFHTRPSLSNQWYSRFVTNLNVHPSIKWLMDPIWRLLIAMQILVWGYKLMSSGSLSIL